MYHAERISSKNRKVIVELDRKALSGNALFVLGSLPSEPGITLCLADGEKTLNIFLYRPETKTLRALKRVVNRNATLRINDGDREHDALVGRPGDLGELDYGVEGYMATRERASLYDHVNPDR